MPQRIEPLASLQRRLLPPRVLAGVLLAIAAVVVSTWATWRSLEHRAASAEAVSHSMRVIERVQALLSAAKDAETGQRGYLLTGEVRYLAPYERAVADIPRLLEELGDETSDDPVQRERVRAITATLANKLTELEETIAMRRAGDAQRAVSVVTSDRGRTAMNDLRELAGAAVAHETTRLEERQAAWRDAQDLSAWITFGGASLLMLLILGATWLMASDYRRREDDAWVRQAQVVLGEALQGETRLAPLVERALGVIARALGAPVARAYVVDSIDHVVPVAGHGTTVDPSTPLPAGDGIVREAVRSGAVVHVTRVPPDYLAMRSGLGSATVRDIVLAPATSDRVVNAVFELGLLGPLPAAGRTLLDRIGDVVGAAVRASRDHDRLVELLDETQRQAEELQTQQEELRVTNEELEQQSRVLSESQARLEVQQVELEQSNAKLEERTAALEQQKRGLLAAQRALEENAAKLAAASRYKSEFLANMSHELRTPLNSALILSKLLAANKLGTLTAEQVKYAEAIHASNNDLLALINDILDLSKIEAGHVDLSIAPVSVAEMVERMQQTFEPLARQKAIGFSVEVAPDAPTELASDAMRLQQVLKNLLANAVKFTERGYVKLVVRGAGADRVAFEVRDTGVGIAREQQEVIFEAFRQADGSTSRRFGGTGLGLSISRQLARRLGGDVAVDSEPGRGSVFTFELPIHLSEEVAAASAVPEPTVSAASPASRAPAAIASETATRAPSDEAREASGVADDRAERRHPGRLILAIEDDPRFAQVIVDLAHDLGFDCIVAGSGSEALALARELSPNGILLDVGLPDQSGLGVLERLKRDPATRHIPVHVVSTHERTQTALELGAIGYLQKPTDRDQLAAVFRQLEDRLQQKVRHLLIVEDDAQLRESLKLLLEGDQIEIDTAGTIADALAKLAADTYDCMVMDLVLPDGSGYELLERLAAGTQAFPPVIVYTGRALSRDEEQRLRRYSKSIIVKGARSPERLLDEVTLFLHSVEATLPESQQSLLSKARQRDAVLEGRQILLAEDDVRNIFALTSVFEPLGARLEIARNGREALERLAEKKDIDLVLMDIMMPEMDGLAAMREIRAKREHANLPIIALTAKAMADDRDRCLEAGANDYIAKPLDVDKLVSLCRVWMPK